MDQDERARLKKKYLEEIATWEWTEIEAACLDYRIDAEESTAKYVTARLIIRDLLAKTEGRTGSVVTADNMIETFRYWRSKLAPSEWQAFRRLFRKRKAYIMESENVLEEISKLAVEARG